MLPVKFYQIPFSGFKERSKMTQLIRAIILVFRSARKTNQNLVKNENLVEDVKFLLPVKIPLSGFREVKNVAANQRPGGHLDFPIGPKNTSLLEDIVVLLPVMFPKILFIQWQPDDQVKPRPCGTCIKGENVNLLPSAKSFTPFKGVYIAPLIN